MYQIYTTEAIIIKSTPTGEANRLYFLLTRDLGFIKASAQGVRLEKSKLKSHLQDFCTVHASLIKGKEMWRIISVETIDQKPFAKNPDKLLVVKNIFSLLLRLLHGEEKNEGLFDSVYAFYNFISHHDISKDNLKNLEIIVVLRILYHLGYLKQSFDLEAYAQGSDLSDELLSTFQDKKKLAITEINAALHETSL
jgi:DNA repair protein RecO